MSEFWGITLLLFVILAVLTACLVRAASYYKKYYLVRHERARLTARAPTLKSGDMVLFIAHTHGFTNSLFTWDLYSHAGMIVEIEGRLFLSESTVDSLPDAGGAEMELPRSSQITPLFRRLKFYPGTAFLMQLERPLKPEQKEILLRRARLRVPYPSALQIVKAVLGFPVHRWARHCMQHVAWLLDEMGLTPALQAKKGETLLGAGFFKTSRAVTSLPGKLLGDGTNRYGQTVELLYDLDVGGTPRDRAQR